MLALDHFSPRERILEGTGELLRPHLGLSDRKAFLCAVNDLNFRSAGPNIAHPLGHKTRATLKKNQTKFSTNKPVVKGGGED